MGIDIVIAARELRKRIKTIHLSDYQAGQTHVFIGEGELDFANFFDNLDKKSISAVTLECSLLPIGIPNQEISHKELISRMREARLNLENLIK